MRICFLCSDITNIGGIERWIALLSSSLSKTQDIEIDIVSRFHTYESPNYIIDPSVSIRYITNNKFSHKPHSFRRLIQHITSINDLRFFFNSNPYDRIVIASFPNIFLAFLSRIELHKIIAVEQVYWGYYTSSWIKRLRKYIYSKLKTLVVLTRNDKEYFDNILPDTKVMAIPNPIDISQNHLSSLGYKTIITVGRLEYQKGYDNLISIFMNVHKKHPEWRLLIYGKGTLRDKLQVKIEKLKLNNFVLLKGVTNDINSAYRQADFFVMTSLFEGFGNVLVEAMSQGIPCVSFRCPNGPEDIIKHNENGLLVKNQDMFQMEEAINYMIEHPREVERMGKNSLQYAKNFDVEIIKEKWLGIL